MSERKQPTFLVSAYSDPVVVKVIEKANCLNSNAFRDFIETTLANGSSRILIDFEECKGMDSTFLGILAGAAIELRKLSPAGELTLGNLSERNYELICNLGLHNLLTVTIGSKEDSVSLDPLKNEEISDAKNILRAHEDLAQADEGNVAKFQDVIAFLRNQVDDRRKD